MTIIRRKAVKPKIQKKQGDFKKLKSKVGKKVIRANVTKISVHSKQLHVPIQKQASEDLNSQDEGAKLNEMLRGLQHHNESSRKGCIDELKRFLFTSSNTESYIAMVFPQAMELLFDEEKDSRQALVDLLSSILSTYNSDAFRSIISVSITYICSGLTSLNKGIRRDSLLVLIRLAELHPALLSPFYEKIAERIMALLIDPALVGASTSNSYANATRNTKAIPNTSKTAPKADLSTLALNAFQLLLMTTESSDESTSTYSKISSENIQTTTIVLRTLLRNPRNVNTMRSDHRALLIPSRSDFISNSKDSIHNQNHNQNHNHAIRIPFSIELINKLLIRLISIWNALVSGSESDSLQSQSQLTLLAISYLQKIVTICLHISKYPPYLESGLLQQLIQGCFSTFPCSCLDVILAAPGSDNERKARGAMDVLNLSICELTIIVHSHSNSNSNSLLQCEEENSIATEFIQKYLENIVLAVERGDTLSIGLEDVGEESQLSTRMKTLFRTMEIIIVSSVASSSSSTSTNTATATAINNDWSVVANLLRRLIYEGSKRLSKNIKLLRPSIFCLCRLAQDHQHQDRDIIVAEALAVVTPTLVQYPGEPGLMTEKVSYAVLDVLRRCPSVDGSVTGTSTSTSSSSSPVAMIALGQSILSLFQSNQSLPLSSSLKSDTKKKLIPMTTNNIDIFYINFPLELRLQWLSIWYYAPYTNLLQSACIIASCIAKSSTSTSSEDSYLLKILFDKRQEMSVGGLVNLLSDCICMRLEMQLKRRKQIDSIENTAVSFIKNRMKIAIGVEGMDVDVDGMGEHWLAHDVGDMLRLMTSTGSVGMFKVALVCLEGVERYYTNKSNNSNNNDNNNNILLGYTITVTIADIACSMFRHMSIGTELNKDDINTATSADVQEKIDSILELFMRVILTCLAINFPVEIDNKIQNKKSETNSGRVSVIENLLDPIFNLMVVAVSLSREGSSESPDKRIVRLLLQQWKLLELPSGKAMKTSFLLQSVANHRWAIGSKSVVRCTLEYFLAEISM
eukprot:gene1486-2857_t